MIYFLPETEWSSKEPAEAQNWPESVNGVDRGCGLSRICGDRGLMGFEIIHPFEGKPNFGEEAL